MKRSEINAAHRAALACFQRHHWILPPAPRWDITDFGLGDFERKGLVLFTIRNGDPAMLASGTGKLYAEKLLICDPDQITLIGGPD